MEISLENLYVDIGALKRVKYHHSKFQLSPKVQKGHILASSKLVTLFIPLQLML